jgi:hypothetical protein
MQVKNEDPRELVRDLPWVLGRELASLAFIAAFDRGRLGAVRAFASQASAAWRKRARAHSQP